MARAEARQVSSGVHRYSSIHRRKSNSRGPFQIELLRYRPGNEGTRETLSTMVVCNRVYMWGGE